MLSYHVIKNVKGQLDKHQQSLKLKEKIARIASIISLIFKRTFHHLKTNPNWSKSTWTILITLIIILCNKKCQRSIRQVSMKPQTLEKKLAICFHYTIQRTFQRLKTNWNWSKSNMDSFNNTHYYIYYVIRDEKCQKFTLWSWRARGTDRTQVIRKESKLNYRVHRWSKNEIYPHTHKKR